MTDRQTSSAVGDGVSVRLLVIEDDADTAALVTEALEARFGAGCVAHVHRIARLGELDLSAFEAALCDFNLPDGTGLDALARLRGRGFDGPVIMVTGQSQPETAIAAIRAGASDYVVKTREFLSSLALIVEKNLATARMQAENRRLQAALNESLEEVRERNRDLQEAVQKLEQMALTDELTGLANRRRLQGLLGHLFAQAVRYRQDLACIMVDLDGFKEVNDTLGHQRGDEVLAMAGSLIAEQVRSADVAARFGGDEFIVLLPHTSCETAIHLAQRLSRAFEDRAAALVGPLGSCRMSVGISCLNLSHPANPDQLLAHADKALYAAKAAGKRTVMVCGANGEARPALGEPPAAARLGR
ncbi:MAG: diguanylate cyclase [Phycisphaerales bacterium]|nr:diguanylate cyclase [Phycisphaerales bacterium]